MDFCKAHNHRRAKGAAVSKPQPHPVGHQADTADAQGNDEDMVQLKCALGAGQFKLDGQWFVKEQIGNAHDQSQCA